MSRSITQGDTITVEYGLGDNKHTVRYVIDFIVDDIIYTWREDVKTDRREFIYEDEQWRPKNPEHENYTISFESQRVTNEEEHIYIVYALDMVEGRYAGVLTTEIAMLAMLEVLKDKHKSCRAFQTLDEAISYIMSFPRKMISYDESDLDDLKCENHLMYSYWGKTRDKFLSRGKFVRWEIQLDIFEQRLRRDMSSNVDNKGYKLTIEIEKIPVTTPTLLKSAGKR